MANRLAVPASDRRQRQLDAEVPGAFEAKVQVKLGHYGLQYDNPARWVNYGAQVRAVLECGPRTVLEVGTGNGTVAGILRQRGVEVTTVDIDPALGPDIVGSVHELDRCVSPESYDVVLCAEVLEHLPFELFGGCCRRLAALARTRVVIGLPCFPKPRWGFELALHIPRIGLQMVRATWSPLPRWPGPDREHHWAVDYRPYPLAHVLRAIPPTLTVEDVRREPLDPGHIVLLCTPIDEPRPETSGGREE